MENAANLRRRYGDVELVISCGDMPPVYLDYITSILGVPLMYVQGNHDDNYPESPPGGQNLHGEIVTYRGLTFVGLEGSMRYNNGTIQYNDAQMMSMVLGLGPQLKLRQMQKGHGLDLFVTHAPPKGIHDKPDLPHQGFAAFLRFMEWYKPRYMIHGHVHTYDRRDVIRTDFQQTCVMNINPVTVLEIEPIS
jgi:uncharacterized protein